MEYWRKTIRGSITYTHNLEPHKCCWLTLWKILIIFSCFMKNLENQKEECSCYVIVININLLSACMQILKCSREELWILYAFWRMCIFNTAYTIVKTFQFITTHVDCSQHLKMRETVRLWIWVIGHKYLLIVSHSRIDKRDKLRIIRMATRKLKSCHSSKRGSLPVLDISW